MVGVLSLAFWFSQVRELHQVTVPWMVAPGSGRPKIPHYPERPVELCETVDASRVMSVGSCGVMSQHPSAGSTGAADLARSVLHAGPWNS